MTFLASNVYVLTGGQAILCVVLLTFPAPPLHSYVVIRITYLLSVCVSGWTEWLSRRSPFLPIVHIAWYIVVVAGSQCADYFSLPAQRAQHRQHPAAEQLLFSSHLPHHLPLPGWLLSRPPL